MTHAEFYARYPEFATLENSAAGIALLDSMIAEATLEVNADRWGEETDVAIRLLAAHKLAISPWGNSVKLSPGDGTSPYLTEYKRKGAMVGSGGLLL